MTTTTEVHPYSEWLDNVGSLTRAIHNRNQAMDRAVDNRHTEPVTGADSTFGRLYRERAALLEEFGSLMLDIPTSDTDRINSIRYALTQLVS
jgi:hypothetical protein